MLDLRIAQVVSHKLVEVSNGKRANSSRIQYDRGREAEENVKAVRHCTWIERRLPLALDSNLLLFPLRPHNPSGTAWTSRTSSTMHCPPFSTTMSEPILL
jgi:hypothetical protein